MATDSGFVLFSSVEVVGRRKCQKCETVLVGMRRAPLFKLIAVVGTLRNGAAGQRSIEQAHLGIAARPFAQAHRYSRHAEKRRR